jgi:hypothetical protein
MKKIIVDIDNTLWHFAPVLYERMKEVNPDFAPPAEWHTFDHWKNYISPRAFYNIIKGIHMDQEQFTPYPDAQLFLESLKELDFHITIASHREKGTLGVTVNWLNKHNLIFDEIHLSYDKTVLFDDCWAIVDDSPFTLQKAASSGIIATGLTMLWNEHEDYPVFDNLTEVLRYLKDQL